MSVDSAVGSPTRSSRAAATKRSTNSSWIDCSTRMRLPARQTSPLLWKIPAMLPGTARSRSQSAKTMLADLPPSSKETGVSAGAAAAMIAWPVRLSPVKVMRSIPGWRVSASPTSPGPKPWTTFSTPAGIPASSASRPRRSALSGVCSAGFKTTVQPKASAGAAFQLACISGKFQGLMQATTPAGS